MLLAATSDEAELAALVARRVAGEPLEQVVGWASFCGVRVAVAPGVFVPRRRTELLVAVAAAVAAGIAAEVATGAAVAAAAGHAPGERPVVLDLCCGTGALGAALLARLGVPATLHATDRDPVAAGCARRNVPPGAQVYCGDLFDPLPPDLRGGVDVLLANAPYVPSGEIGLLPAEAREHEHRIALDGGGDGLDVHRRIAAQAPSWLAPGGTLLIEVSDRQRLEARGLLHAAGLVVIEHTDDDLGALVLSANRPPSLRS